MNPKLEGLLLALALGAFAGCNDGDDTADTDTDTVDTDTDTTPPPDTDDTDTDTTGDTDTDTTPPTDGLFSLTFTGSEYNPHDGQMMYFLVKNPNIPAEPPVATDSLQMDNTGMFNLSFPDVMEDGTAYSIAWYADQNNDGNCADGDDHMWSIPVVAPTGTPVTADATVNSDHNIMFTPVACTLLNDAF